MKNFLLILLASIGCAMGQSYSPQFTNGAKLLAPLGLFSTNILPGANITVTPTTNGRVIIASNGGGGGITYLDATNAAQGVLSASAVAYLSWLQSTNTALQALVASATNLQAAANTNQWYPRNSNPSAFSTTTELNNASNTVRQLITSGSATNAIANTNGVGSDVTLYGLTQLAGSSNYVSGAVRVDGGIYSGGSNPGILTLKNGGGTTVAGWDGSKWYGTASTMTGTSTVDTVLFNSGFTKPKLAAGADDELILTGEDGSPGQLTVNGIKLGGVIQTSWPSGSGIDAPTGTNISRYVSGHSSNVWYNVMDFGATGVGLSHDDTPAIQAALDAAIGDTNSATHAIVYFPKPPLYYNLSGPATNENNSQLIIREKTHSNQAMSLLELVGETAIPSMVGTATTGLMPFEGSVLQSHLSGAGSNVLMVASNKTESPFFFGRVHINFRNLDFRTTPAFAGEVLNLINMPGGQIVDCQIGKTNFPGSLGTNPPTSGTYAIRGPRYNLFNMFNVERVNIIGYDTGLEIGEHVTIPFVNIVQCGKAVALRNANLANYADHIMVQQCNYGLYFVDGGNITCDNLSMECDAVYWSTNIAHIGGSSASIGVGKVNIWINDGAAGQHNNIINRQRNVSAHNIRDGKTWYSDSTGSSFKTRGPQIVYQPASTSGFIGGMTLLKHNESTTYPFGPIAVSSGQDLMEYRGGGYTGAAGDLAPASFGFGADSTVSSGTLPTEAYIKTGTTEANSTKRLTVSSGGAVTISNTLAVAGGVSVGAGSRYYGHGGGLTNLYSTNIVMRSAYSTNAWNGVSIDANYARQRFTTNANMAIASFSGMTAGVAYQPTVIYSNSSASTITIAGPPTTRYFGTASTNTVYLPAGKQCTWAFDVELGICTNAVNLVEQ